MTDARQEALIELYRAFNGRDMDGAMAHLAPGVDWQNGWEGGRVTGRDAVRALWQRHWAADNTEIQPMAFAVDPDGKVRVRVHRLVTSPDGTVLDNSKLEHVFEFDGPFIKRMSIVSGPPDDEDDAD